MNLPDPRQRLARPDLADRRLEGQVRAAAYAAVRPMRCAAPATGLHEAPDPASVQQDQLLYGETFDVLDMRNGWAWGQARRDGYVGFVRSDALAPGREAPTHRVRALRTVGLTAPELKAAARGVYSMNALVAAGEERDGWLDAGQAGWIFARHLAPLGRFEAEPAAVAERYFGTPYLWGGRDSVGIDCSGLIQQAFYACGRACPRDADQQMDAFPVAVEPDALQRGDLVFWDGHVGMMLDDERLLHANSHHMAVAIERLSAVVERNIGAGVGEPLGARRV